MPKTLMPLLFKDSTKWKKQSGKFGEIKIKFIRTL